MKQNNRIVAFALVLIMLTACFTVFGSATGFAFTTKGAKVNINEDVTYQRYDLTSGENGNKVEAVAMEFDPADGYIPMAFISNAGSATRLKSHYNTAMNKYGYEVVGVINGSFFSMADGTLVHSVVSNGKVFSSHAGDSAEVIAFTEDGKAYAVNSCLDFSLYINGASAGSLYYVNKTSGTAESKASNWGNGFYYYDTSCGSIADTNPYVNGYHVLCKKLDNTDLVISRTMKGEVISVTHAADQLKVSEGYEDESDKFLIFVKETSTNAKYVKDLKEGDSVNITVTETVESSREIMEKANSAIANVGWLVKDGVDRTHIDSTIGTHSVTLQARWTALGTRPDGSWVFFTSEGGSTGSNGSVTLRDVAAAMMQMGCNNVFRMDGGGSTAMYVKDTGDGNPGYVMVSGTESTCRAVSDCILIVKKSSVQKDELTGALQNRIAELKAGGSLEAAVQEAVEEAETYLAETDVPVTGTVRSLLAKINEAASGKDELQNLLANAAGVSYQDYSEEVLTELRAAYANGSAVFGDPEATGEQVKAATDALAYWLALTGDQEFPLSIGAKYTIDQGKFYSNPTYVDAITDDGKRLTDGRKGSTEITSPAYTAFESGSSQKPIITIDLGEVKEADSFKLYAGGGDWGISAPVSVLVEVSEDGSAYTAAGTMKGSEGRVYNESAPWKSTELKLALDSAVKVRYARFTVTTTGNFGWFDELEVCRTAKPVQNAVYITQVNKQILTNDCSIFTSAVGNLSNQGAVNAKYTQNVFLKWNEEAGYYVVTKNSFGGGSAPNVTLEEDEILLAVHGDSGTTGYPNRQRASKFQVGDRVAFYGVDFENETLTVAPYAVKLDYTVKFVNWDNTVISEKVYAYGDKVEIPEDPTRPDVNGKSYTFKGWNKEVAATVTEDITYKATYTEGAAFVPGDVNGNGKIDTADYAMCKRAYLKTFTLSEEQLMRADINKNGKVDASEYAMIKRHYLKTYTIPGAEGK
ncbi:MAG: phosphodiester glycosidase family protein [Clostridia bacterium]|nr:phosphodiester glycosidase family protein [Clostridia bacterium]